jgi:hypothetical protein
MRQLLFTDQRSTIAEDFPYTCWHFLEVVLTQADTTPNRGKDVATRIFLAPFTATAPKILQGLGFSAQGLIARYPELRANPTASSLKFADPAKSAQVANKANVADRLCSMRISGYAPC